MGIFNRKKPEIRADTGMFGTDDALLKAILGTAGITKSVALQIPTVAGGIDLISNIIASTPIKLYELVDDKVQEVKGDQRVTLLNDETGDTLNAREFWRAIIPDYYLGKGGYAYINRVQGNVASLHYVDEVQISIMNNVDPIFKDYDILVQGVPYKPYDFIKILRNTKDGAQGIGIIAENSKVLEVAYESLVFESALVKKGGNKKGFLTAEKHLTDPAMKDLKAAYRKLYGNNEENVVVLNDGVKFQESSNSSVEMQLNENKESNAKELCKILHISPEAIIGKASEADMTSIAKLAAIPLMKTIECALNRDLLLEKEKKSFYWAFDTKELLKGNLKERIDAYSVAIDSGIMTRNEARFTEDLPSLNGMDVIVMGLADVIYDPKTGTYFTPNTKLVTDLGQKTTEIVVDKTKPQQNIEKGGAADGNN